MTPKEKAQELFGKYAMYLRANLRYDEEANEDAKVCALIAVDEILKAHLFNEEENHYFIEVKQEIEAL
jgi:hypothetical protein